jgi:hypothetical protein
VARRIHPTLSSSKPQTLARCPLSENGNSRCEIHRSLRQPMDDVRAAPNRQAIGKFLAAASAHPIILHSPECVRLDASGQFVVISLIHGEHNSDRRAMGR